MNLREGERERGRRRREEEVRESKRRKDIVKGGCITHTSITSSNG